jgi:hypothetical protein
MLWKEVTVFCMQYLKIQMGQNGCLGSLGFSDGLHGHVAIVPISEYENAADSYQGKEYLGLYPYVTTESIQYGSPRIFVRKSGATSEELKGWLKSKQAIY